MYTIFYHDIKNTQTEVGNVSDDDNGLIFGLFIKNEEYKLYYPFYKKTFGTEIHVKNLYTINYIINNIKINNNIEISNDDIERGKKNSEEEIKEKEKEKEKGKGKGKSINPYEDIHDDFKPILEEHNVIPIIQGHDVYTKFFDSLVFMSNSVYDDGTIYFDVFVKKIHPDDNIKNLLKSEYFYYKNYILYYIYKYTFTKLRTPEFFHDIKTIFNFKTNTFVQYYIYLHDIYIINNERFIKLDRENSIFIEFIGRIGDRLGNNLFGIFRSITIILKNDYEKYDYKKYNYIFIYIDTEKELNGFINKLVIKQKYINSNKINSNLLYHDRGSFLSKLMKIYAATDILQILLLNNQMKEIFKNVILSIIGEELTIVQPSSKKKISLHYRLSDFCSGDLDTDHNSKCISSNSSKPSEPSNNIIFPILSFQYYANIINKIIENNKVDYDQSKLLIIIYYLQTNIDYIIVMLLKDYLISKFEKLEIIFEHEYYVQTTSELALLYSAGNNDIVILSNSTFGYWMSFFNILKSYTDTTKLTSVYFGQYLLYTNKFLIKRLLHTDSEKEIYNLMIYDNGYLMLDKDILNSPNEAIFTKLEAFDYFDDKCVIDYIDIYYFTCYLYDMVRIFLVIYYYYKKMELPLPLSSIAPECESVINRYYCYFNTKLYTDTEYQSKSKTKFPSIKTLTSDYSKIAPENKYTEADMDLQRSAMFKTYQSDKIAELKGIFEFMINETHTLDEILFKISYSSPIPNYYTEKTTYNAYFKKYLKYKNKYVKLKNKYN
jgi:hypothetical protein